nr:hypothetical protein [Tanacetum cinerariifolium]
SGYLEFGQKKQSSTSFLIRSISGSKICRGDGISSQVDKEALVSVADRKSMSLSEKKLLVVFLCLDKTDNEDVVWGCLDCFFSKVYG